MRRHLSDRLFRLVAGLVASSPMLQATAQADPVIGVDVNGNIEYSTNPFLTEGAKTETALAALTVQPFIEFNTPRSQTRLSGTLSHSEYSRLYNSSTDYAAMLNYSNTLSTRLSMRAAAAFESNASGNYGPQPVSISGIPNPLPNPTDITLIGRQDRRNQFRGTMGLSFTPDPRNSWSLDYSAVTLSLPDTPLIGGVRQGEYSSISQDFGYRRTINSKLSVGAGVGVNRIDYRRTAIGAARIISPNVNAQFRLSSRWNLSAGIGVTFLRQTTAFGPMTSQNLSLSLSACRIAPRDSFCFSGSRAVSPSSLGDARKTTSVGATYSYRLTTRDELSFSGNYVRSDESVGGPISSVDFIGGGMAFKRQMTNKFAINLNAGFSRVDYTRTRSDARVGLGISYRLDNRR